VRTSAILKPNYAQRDFSQEGLDTKNTPYYKRKKLIAEEIKQKEILVLVLDFLRGFFSNESLIKTRSPGASVARGTPFYDRSIMRSIYLQEITITLPV
jgi:hypothetical protein